MTNFGDLWLKLGGLALEYAFIIPSYYILVMRSFATFEGIAETVDGEFDIYSAAMPYAARRALAPTTADGAAALKVALVDESGALRVDRLAAAVPRREQRGTAPASVRAAATVVDVSDASSSAAAAAAAAPSSTAAAGMLTHLLLEARDGRALRRVLLEVDTLAAVRYVLSPAGLELRRVAAVAAVESWHLRGGQAGAAAERGEGGASPSSSSSSSLSQSGFSYSMAEGAAEAWRRRGAWRRRRVLAVLLSAHASR
jgi:hypothetical protein